MELNVEVKQVRALPDGRVQSSKLYDFRVDGADLDDAMLLSKARVARDGRRVRGASFTQDPRTGGVGGIVVSVMPREGEET